MIENMLRRNLVFVAGWVLAGLGIAFVVNQLWSRHEAVSPQAAVPSLPGNPALPSPTAVATPTGLAGGAANTASESPAPTAPADAGTLARSYASAVRIGAPAVVSISTQQVAVERRLQR